MSHHPPVSAFHGSGLEGAYELSGEYELRTKFWGKSIEVNMHGHVRLELKQHNEVYLWNRCRLMINDVILGKEAAKDAAGSVTCLRAG